MPPSSEAAARFRDLHRQGLLRLANAWDAGTARLIEQRGAAAVATTSAGLAWAQGYADGDRLDPDVLLQAVSRIARVIRVPLTVDVEGGYSDDPDSVAALVLRVVHAGAAAINRAFHSRNSTRAAWRWTSVVVSLVALVSGLISRLVSGLISGSP